MLRDGVRAWVWAAVALTLSALMASQAAAVEWPLTGKAHVSVRARHHQAYAHVRFQSHPSSWKPADPRCPAATSVRLLADRIDTGEIQLPCERWQNVWGSYVYHDRFAAAGGVHTVIIGRGRLSIGIKLDERRALRRASFLEAQLSVGPDRYCGRIESLHHRPISAARRSSLCEEIRPQPNFIVINLDDARFDNLDRMPVVQNELASEGARFEYAFTPNSTCCPSRASLLTGLYSINHRTLTVALDIGGAKRLREFGGDQETIAVWLSEAGYRTGLFGKYLNLYSDATEAGKGPGGSFYIPPGWSRWWAMVTPEHYGGIHGQPYEILEEDGTRTLYDDASSDEQYSTDLTAVKLREFVAESVRDDRPFFAYWNPYAPHVDTPAGFAEPADRHFGLFANLDPWRPPSWNEADVSDKPAWVRALPLASPFSVAKTDVLRQRGYESLLSVDEQIGAILDQLVELEIDRDTVIILTSDNGASWGEHRWFGGLKGCAYEECQRVPMIVRYPRRVRPGIVVDDAAALNIDLAPTIAAMAGVEVPVPIDGVSFEPALLGLEDADRRTDYMMESWRIVRSSVLVASGQVSDGDRVRLFYGDPLLSPRTSVLFEFDDGDGVVPGAVPVLIAANDLQSTLTRLRDLLWIHVPKVLPILREGTLGAGDLTPEHFGTMWFVEADQGEVLAEAAPGLFGGLVVQIPDFLGVRDIVSGHTWVEYETGERELYDLFEDPYQLENRADDPAYAGIRAALEERLQELRDEASLNALPDPTSGEP